MKNYLITGLLALIMVLLLFTCNQKPKVISNNIHTKDSTHTTDTFYSEHTKEHWNLRVDTFYIDSNAIESFSSVYVYPIKDSLLEATITARSESRPIIDFKYKLKQFEIKTKDVIKDSVYHEAIKNKMYFGGEIVVKPMFTQVYLGVDFAEKNGHLFNLSGGYDLRDNEPLLKVGYKRLISLK